MNAIFQLEALGYTVALEADGIHCKAGQASDRDRAVSFLAEIRAHKAEAIRFLNLRNAPLPERVSFASWPAIRDTYGLRVTGADCEGEDKVIYVTTR